MEVHFTDTRAPRGTVSTLQFYCRIFSTLKRYQSPRFWPQSGTRSIPDLFIWESPRAWRYLMRAAGATTVIRRAAFATWYLSSSAMPRSSNFPVRERVVPRVRYDLVFFMKWNRARVSTHFSVGQQNLYFTSRHKFINNPSLLLREI